jgi:hypothetical protein
LPPVGNYRSIVKGVSQSAALNLGRRPDSASWSLDLPDKLKLAIADCITLYSKIQSCIVELVWLVEDASLKRKKEIAKGWGDQNFRIVKRDIKSILGAESDEIWPALKEIGKERNVIGHGVWMFTNTGRPLVVWHARFLDSDDGVGAEYFDWQRFDYFLDRGRILLSTFKEFKRLFELHPVPKTPS